MTARRLAGLFAVLIVLATAAFVIGVSMERSSGHTESTSEHTESGEGAESHSEGEAHGEGEAHEGTEGGHVEGTSENGSGAEGAETIAGIDIESTPIVVVGVVASLLLAGAALRWPRREVFAAAAVFCVAFAALDAREFLHQLDEDAGDIATLAALAGLFHLAAAGVATVGLRRGRVAPAPSVAG